MNIRLKDLAAELEKPMIEVETVIKQKLSPDQWEQRGRGFFVSDEGAEIVRASFDIPEIVPDKFTALVKSEARNPVWVYIVIPGMEGRHLALIPRRLCGKLVGKTIIVDAITDANGTTFRHEALGK